MMQASMTRPMIAMRRRHLAAQAFFTTRCLPPRVRYFAGPMVNTHWLPHFDEDAPRAARPGDGASYRLECRHDGQAAWRKVLYAASRAGLFSAPSASAGDQAVTGCLLPRPDARRHFSGAKAGSKMKVARIARAMHHERPDMIWQRSLHAIAAENTAETRSPRVPHPPSSSEQLDR